MTPRPTALGGPGRLVLGTAQLRVHYGIARVGEALDEPSAVRMLREAAAIGVDAIDTAPGYGGAEAAIGLAGVPVEVFTKIDASGDPRESITNSLRALRQPVVAGVLLHDSSVLLDDSSKILERAFELVGFSIGALGASVYDAQEFDAALADDRIAFVQAPLSVLDRSLEDHIARAEKLDKPVLARSVFLQGALLMGSALPPDLAPLRPWIERLERISLAAGRPWRELLLSYVRDTPGVAGLVLGADSITQVAENVRLMQCRALSPDVRQLIADIEPAPRSLADPRCWKPRTAPGDRKPGAPR